MKERNTLTKFLPTGSAKHVWHRRLQVSGVRSSFATSESCVTAASKKLMTDSSELEALCTMCSRPGMPMLPVSDTQSSNSGKSSKVVVVREVCGGSHPREHLFNHQRVHVWEAQLDTHVRRDVEHVIT